MMYTTIMLSLSRHILMTCSSSYTAVSLVALLLSNTSFTANLHRNNTRVTEFVHLIHNVNGFRTVYIYIYIYNFFFTLSQLNFVLKII